MSTITFLVESLPQFWDSNNITLNDLEIFVISVFTADYVIRFATSGRRWYKWIVLPLNIIDILAILPFYIQLFIELSGSKVAVGKLAVVRVLRLLRVVRILKLAKHFTIFPLVLDALKNSISGIGLLGFLIMLLLILCSSGMFYAEQTIEHFDAAQLTWLYDADNSTSAFQSIPASFWWCFVTITTVGYGDTFPKSDAGKVVACLTMFCALIALSLPIIMIGNAFNDSIARYKQRKEDRLAILIDQVPQSPIILLKKKTKRASILILELSDELRRISRLIDKLTSEIEDPPPKITTNTVVSVN